MNGKMKNHKPMVIFAYERKVNKFLRHYEKVVEKETKRIHRILDKYGRFNGTHNHSTRRKTS